MSTERPIVPEQTPDHDVRPQFHRELDEIRSSIARLGATVVELIPRVTDILLDQDLEGAEYVIMGDDEIDARSIEIEDHCYRLLALQAPVATDLRDLVSALKMSGEIERSADLCVNICKAARRIYGHPVEPRLRGLIQAMSDQAAKIYKEATEAYIARDTVRAAAIDDMDTYLDELHRAFMQAILQRSQQSTTSSEVATQLAVVARFYERLGDHAVNIGEKVRFIETGWRQETGGAARYLAREVKDTP
jgi:phosphate transport system protein